METQHTIVIDNIHYRLPDLEQDLWRRLLNGSLRSKAPFHTGAVATLGDNGPDVRTVVLRKVDIENHALYFHTDVRSPKYKQLQADPRISWLFYCDHCRMQMRLSARATLHYQDPVAAARWVQTPLQSRKCYLSSHAPGHGSDYPQDGLPKKDEMEGWSLESTQWGLERFCVVQTQVLTLDWLWLNHAGHRRAKFSYNQGRLVDAQWILP